MVKIEADEARELMMRPKLSDFAKAMQQIRTAAHARLDNVFIVVHVENVDELSTTLREMGYGVKNPYPTDGGKMTYLQVTWHEE